MKQAFDASGIEIPFPHLTVYAGVDKAGEAPPFRWLASSAERASAASNVDARSGAGPAAQ
ncbi:MAG: hypothetical protein ABJB78_05795 [Betaproteobacteria bacterium]